MEVSHTPVDKPTSRDCWTALKELAQRVSALLAKYEASTACEFEDFERELRDCWTALKELAQRVSALLAKYEASTACEFEDFERTPCSPRPSARSPKKRWRARMWTFLSCSSTARCIAGPVAVLRPTSLPPAQCR